MVQPDERPEGGAAPTGGPGRRPRWLLVLAVLVAVALVAAVVVWASSGGDDAAAPGPTPSSATTSPGTSATSTSPSPTASGHGAALPVYWVGEQGSTFALFREFGPAGPADPAARVQEAVTLALTGTPADPDYLNPWGSGATATTELGSGEISVDLSPAAITRTSVGSQLASLLVQQLVWTATAAAQQDVPVRFTVGGQVQDLFGTISADQPIARGRGDDDPRALVWISEPGEQGSVPAEAATFRGEGVNAFENTLVWRIEQDGVVTDDGFFGVTSPAGGPVEMGQRGEWVLRPEAPLPPGRYTLTVEVPDESGGESTLRWFDSKTFTAR